MGPPRNMTTSVTSVTSVIIWNSPIYRLLIGINWDYLGLYGIIWDYIGIIWDYKGLYGIMDGIIDGIMDGYMGSGWWFFATPLKNHGRIVSWDQMTFPILMEKS